jgi:phosphoribosyl-ATP pyrophosphohydrolase/phosphoribosyl-AMP cyclohydrolase
MKKINWKKMNGLVPAIIQDADSSTILMLGYMNRESLTKTRKTKKVWFYSRSKKRLWMKGETSGNTLALVDIKTDCDGDALLVKAKPLGPTCHTGSDSCFEDTAGTILERLFSIVSDRKQKPRSGSYTTSLFRAGLNSILLKVAEESLEIVHAAQKQTRERVIEETADLLFNLCVLLVEKEISIEDLRKEMRSREKKRESK